MLGFLGPLCFRLRTKLRLVEMVANPGFCNSANGTPAKLGGGLDLDLDSDPDSAQSLVVAGPLGNGSTDCPSMR